MLFKVELKEDASCCDDGAKILCPRSVFIRGSSTFWHLIILGLLAFIVVPTSEDFAELKPFC